jgi:hypothetical protein
MHRAAVRVRAVSRREAWLSAGAVFLLALIVRSVAAATVAFPVPEDTAYYAGVARNLVEGHGLITDALWSYQTPPLTVPRAAFEVWMPLPSFLYAAAIWVAGAANWFRAAQVVSAVVSSIVAVLAWRLGADVAAEMKLPVGRARTLAVGSGVVASFLGSLVLYGALPDSTALFAALSLAACLLMTRIAARAAGTGAGAEGAAAEGAGTAAAGPRLDRRLIGLGLLIGLAGLTRSEAVWLGLAWAFVAWRLSAPGGGRLTRRERLRLIAVPAAVAVLVFAPWAVRDWIVFGSPLPGQTLSNALSVNPTDIFAYQNQPTLANYLAQGPAALIGMRVTGTFHNLLDVLILPGFPIGFIGLLTIRRSAGFAAVRPLLIVALTTFVVTSLVFPVSTTWGTFLHAAGAIYVLLIVSCLVALDALIAWVHRFRHWWRPVAWLGPALASAVAIPLLFVSMISLDRAATKIHDRYDALPTAMARAGVPLDGSAPVITDNPIWLAESARVTALSLPEESPQAVLDLARRFGSRLLVVVKSDDGREWPAILDAGGPATQCFREVELTDNSGNYPKEGTPLAQLRVFRIVCP